MQIAQPPEQASTVTVAASYALDLAWVLHAAEMRHLRDQHADIGSIFDEHPRLMERAQTFWPDATCFTELQVLAQLSGVLEVTDPQQVMEALAGGCDAIPDHTDMQSETEADRLLFNRRLVQLRDDPTIRRRYFELLNEITDVIAGPWLARGLPVATATAQSLQTQLSRGSNWAELVPATCETFLAHRPDIENRVESGAPLLIAPCAYFGCGLYLDIEGSVVVGAPVSRDDVIARSRTEELAKRLKVLADPTRLAIVDYLVTNPRSVNDITQAFGLAQPTVSNHLKVLREAGLVASERQSGKLVVRADRRAVSDLADRLQAVFA